MSRIATYEDEIVTAIKAEFTGTKPFISADMNFGDKGDGAKVLDRAKLHTNSKYGGGAIFIGYTGMDYNAQTLTAGINIYKPIYMFAIMMFSLNRRKTSVAHIDIYTLLETVMKAVYKKEYILYRNDNIPVKIDKTGLYNSTLTIGNYKPFPYETL